MKRIPEPELMNGPEQARAYAEADFSEPHNHFIQLFDQTFAEQAVNGFVLDLGCGPADISIRFARQFPETIIHGLDGAIEMLKLGQDSIQQAHLSDRVELYEGLVPDAELPLGQYDIIISNSLLHHLHQPENLWQMVKAYARSGTRLFIMDLMRPASLKEAEDMVAIYAQDEPGILQRDFYNSLLAAFTVEEVRQQLKEADLTFLAVEPISDRHLCIQGIFQ